MRCKLLLPVARVLPLPVSVKCTSDKKSPTAMCDNCVATTRTRLHFTNKIKYFIIHACVNTCSKVSRACFTDTACRPD